MRGVRAAAATVVATAVLAPVAQGGYYPYPPAPTETVAPSSYSLSVAVAGDGQGSVSSSPGGITCGTDCSEAYSSGTVVTLAATPDPGSQFAGWSGACQGTGSCAVTMSSAQTVTATFSRSEQSQAPAADTTLEATVVRVRAVTRRGKRLVRIELAVDEPVHAELQLRRKRATLARRSVDLAGADRTVTLSVPRRIAAGRATVRIALEDAAGNEQTIVRSIRLPAAP